MLKLQCPRCGQNDQITADKTVTLLVDVENHELSLADDCIRPTDLDDDDSMSCQACNFCGLVEDFYKKNVQLEVKLFFEVEGEDDAKKAKAMVENLLERWVYENLSIADIKLILNSHNWEIKECWS